MLRAREVERAPLTETCSKFGFSRESYRHISRRFYLEGIPGLFGHKRGRKGPIKATEELRGFIRLEHTRDRSLTADDLASRCYQEYGVTISRRTVFRILEKDNEEKKNEDEKSNTYIECDSFLSWGGEPQPVYEQFRSIALDGGDEIDEKGFSLFKKWGMTLFLYGYCKGSFWTITRVRAPVRAGDFSLKELLLELGILRGVSQLQKDIAKKEVCL